MRERLPEARLALKQGDLIVRTDRRSTVRVRASFVVTLSVEPRQRGFVIWNAPAPCAAHSKADTRFQRNICCYGTE